MSTIVEEPLVQEETSISLADFAALEEIDTPKPQKSLKTLRLSKDPSLISLFTTSGKQVKVYYFDDLGEGQGGYVHAVGQDCPAAKAGFVAKTFMLLPVLDRVSGDVAVLRIPLAQGAGKLLTELQNFQGPEKSGDDVIQIVKPDNWTYDVKCVSSQRPTPSEIRTVNGVKDQLASGEMDITSVYPRLSKEQMADIPKVRATSKLKGLES